MSLEEQIRFHAEVFPGDELQVSCRFLWGERKTFRAVQQIRRSDGSMAIAGVSVVSVPVSDQERAKQFYVERLGLELTREDESTPGIRWVQVTPREGGTSLTLVTWFETMPPGSLQGLVLACDDLERECEQLGARGVQFDRPLEHQPWGTEAVIRDPDGNRLVLHQA